MLLNPVKLTSIKGEAKPSCHINSKSCSKFLDDFCFKNESKSYRACHVCIECFKFKLVDNSDHLLPGNEYYDKVKILVDAMIESGDLQP
jgi:hypothetical protein